MGMSLEEYASTTYYNYHLKCKGFNNKKLDEWKRTRFVAFITMTSSANANPEKLKNLTPEQWLPLEENDKKTKKAPPLYKHKDFKAMVSKFKQVKR